jgi:ribosome-binding factor A
MSIAERRHKQLSSTLLRAAQAVFARGFNDPRIQGLITVTGVELTTDLERARLRVSVLPREKEELTLHGLRHALPHIAREMMGRVEMRTFPRLSIERDEGLRAQHEVQALLAKDRLEREPIEGEGGEAQKDDEGLSGGSA